VRLRHSFILLSTVALCLPSARTLAAPKTVRVGAGSYALVPPPGGKEPPAMIYQTANVPGKMATNGWWSSVAWLPYSERQYPHPLAVQAIAGGLRVYYPGPGITANQAAIFGFMPDRTGDDLVLGHSAQDDFPDARVDGFSDWFVRVAFAAGEKQMLVSYGHGSPLVYALYQGGSAKVLFAKTPLVWAGSAKSAVLGITINGKHYGLFGPSGSTWSGVGTKSLVNQSPSRGYFSLALLPSNSPQMLTLFQKYAYAHVVDTKIAWRYEPETSTVATTFRFTTKAYEGDTAGTLFALYPHQWRHAKVERFLGQYDSVRGVMKLAGGEAFTTRVTFPGVLPSLPLAGALDKTLLNDLLREEAAKPEPRGARDTYWEGKYLGKMATLNPIAEQLGNVEAQDTLTKRLKNRLENWLTATTPQGELKPAGLFCYNANWGTLIGYPASYGSDTDLNDHHFHYGYFIRAAAEIARRDPAWAADERWGGMVKMLIRDIADSDRRDTQFPFLRCFDPYAGHSWASGNAKFGDGNNQESSSEAMSAWCGLILWGEATGDRAIRDLGIFLFTTEMTAINEYWFDVHGSNFPRQYPASVVTMVWGGKGANGTWFSADPAAIHGINWLPLHGGSLYLGQYPAYVKKNYEALVKENRGSDFHQWSDLIWMYHALVDPQDALRQFHARKKGFRPEDGNSLANTYLWIETLNAFGLVDRTVSADYPLCAVFSKLKRRTYVVYNMGPQERTVVFSDGMKLTAKPHQLTVAAK